MTSSSSSSSSSSSTIIHAAGAGDLSANNQNDDIPLDDLFVRPKPRIPAKSRTAAQKVADNSRTAALLEDAEWRSTCLFVVDLVKALSGRIIGAK